MLSSYDQITTFLKYPLLNFYQNMQSWSKYINYYKTMIFMCNEMIMIHGCVQIPGNTDDTSLGK